MNIANTGTQRTLLLGDEMLGAYALKSDPNDNFYSYSNPVTSFGSQKIFAIEASDGANDKGSFLWQKEFSNSDFGDDEASPSFSIDEEASLVGDVLGTGTDVIRLAFERPNPSDSDKITVRIAHFNVRNGNLINQFFFRG